MEKEKEKMKTMKKWNCTWKVTEYTTDNPELFYKTRLHLECIESNNEYYPVGSTMDFAKTE